MTSFINFTHYTKYDYVTQSMMMRYWIMQHSYEAYIF